MKNLAIVLLAATTTFTIACGYSSKTTTPSTPGTLPTISQLTPNSMSHGGAGFVLTVNGSNFSSTAVINFNGAAQTTTFVSANQLMATIPASDGDRRHNSSYGNESRNHRNGSIRQWRDARRNFESHEFHDQLIRAGSSRCAHAPTS